MVKATSCALTSAAQRRATCLSKAPKAGYNARGKLLLLRLLPRVSLGG